MYIYTNQINKNNHTVTQYSHTERSLKIYRSTEGKLMLTLSRMVTGSIKKDIFSLLAGAAANCFSRVRLCVTPETAAHQAPPSLGFSRQEHWSGLPFPSPMHQSEK